MEDIPVPGCRIQDVSFLAIRCGLPTSRFARKIGRPCYLAFQCPPFDRHSGSQDGTVLLVAGLQRLYPPFAGAVIDDWQQIRSLLEMEPSE